MAFELIPSIDLRGGRVVRLREGDFARETAYGADPVSVALGFADAGARWIHLVDLDGASGDARQTAVIGRIIEALDDRAACQVGGGIRSVGDAEATLRSGAARVVLGTAILRDPGLAATLVERYGPEAVVAALDVRDGRALGDAWVAGATARDVDEALGTIADVGVTRFVVTAIARDGGLGGPEVPLLRRLVAARRGAIVASGGITSLADLRAVRDIGCVAAIVGRAIYEGVLDVRTAIATLGEATSP